ncbi:hypothetical protein IE81DRAFT_326065 [Ceraceosorus guamensis]|uniref:Surp module n=1 Tax=Ceraceosorus guamensis TaxID=1522189 RepID=A0A316VUF2_9BASI|nr:hypothetical protein IE81DRAFT_326065 [Ceraceosorus guamensis]PWN39891.1 hypothetical protein IE81DRAFT_326065 [Ceraceosorus guamensis]
MAPGLNLPPPSNGAPTEAGKAARVEDVEEATTLSGAAQAGSSSGPLLEQVSTAEEASAAPKFSTGGVIYPPPDIRSIVDKTATFVARNGVQFEAKIRGDERANTKFAFLNPEDAYHAYYRAKIQFVQSGDGPLAKDLIGQGAERGQLVARDGVETMEEEDAGKRGREDKLKPEEPRQHLFEADLPNITAVDLDVLKLTALFTARKGKSFASALAARESSSYQFEFLRPSHSLFGYFNRMVEQYRLVIQPAEDILEQLHELAPEGPKPALGPGRGGGRIKVLENARKRAKYERWVRERRKAKESEEESQRALFDSIDWQDFVVVQTVELTETDAHIDLPPPMSLRDVENMTIAQKRMAAMIMEVEGGGDESELMGGMIDIPGGSGDAARAGAASATKAASNALPPGMDPQRASMLGLQASAGVPQEDEGDIEMDMDDDSGDEKAVEEAPAVQYEEIKRAEGQAPIRVRKDYVPKSLAAKNAAVAQTTKCPVCGDQIAISEMDEHVRFELLNPKFREQRRDLEAKQAQQKALLEGADPSRALKQFASNRTDIFGAEAEEAARRRRDAEEQRLRKEREKIIWDGHIASRQTTRDAFNQTKQVEQTMANINRNFKAGEVESNIGPQFPGQHGVQPPEGAYAYGAPAAGFDPSQPAQPDASEGSLKRPAEEAPPGQPAAQRIASENLGSASPAPLAGGFAGSPPPGVAGQIPTGPSAMGPPGAPVNAPTGPRMVEPPRPPQPSYMPPGYPAQHQPQAPAQVNSLPKKSSGELYEEHEWLRYNPYPISIKVLLPDAPEISPLCDGHEEVLQGLIPQTTIGQIRDRVHATNLNAQVGVSKMKLRIAGKAATLKQTLAHWNLLDGDTIVITLNK